VERGSKPRKEDGHFTRIVRMLEGWHAEDQGELADGTTVSVYTTKRYRGSITRVTDNWQLISITISLKDQYVDKPQDSQYTEVSGKSDRNGEDSRAKAMDEENGQKRA
jgi:hypothetical protein